MTWMVVRLVLSLVFIGAVLWFAARFAQKRGLGQGNGLIEVVVVDEDFGLRISEIVTDAAGTATEIGAQ